MSFDFGNEWKIGTQPFKMKNNNLSVSASHGLLVRKIATPTQPWRKNTSANGFIAVMDWIGLVLEHLHLAKGNSHNP